MKWYKNCADHYYKLYGKNHEDAARDLKQLGVNYDPANKDTKKDNNDDCAVNNGQVILYDRSGAVLQSATLMDKNGTTHVKVDNGLYKLKPCNVKINGVSYNYSVFLFDRDYYVKGNIPGFKSDSAPTKHSSSTTTKSSNPAPAKSSSSAPAKKETKSEKSVESIVKKEVGKKVEDLKKLFKK